MPSFRPPSTHGFAALRLCLAGVGTAWTPNGNDYGKNLLRQHHERHAHDPAHGHED